MLLRKLMFIGMLTSVSTIGFASSITIPAPEAAAIHEGQIYIVSMGETPDFGSDEINGQVYQLSTDAPASQMNFKKASLKNPTALYVDDTMFVLPDGNRLVAINLQGSIIWQQTLDVENAFLYDVAGFTEKTLIVSDYGNGQLYTANKETGEMTLLKGISKVPGLARVVASNPGRLYATTWGSDKGFDGQILRFDLIETVWQVTSIATGFGNPEAIQELADGSLTIGAWRGHYNNPNARVFTIGVKGEINSIEAYNNLKGPADFAIEGQQIIIPVLMENKVLIDSLSNLAK